MTPQLQPQDVTSPQSTDQNLEPRRTTSFAEPLPKLHAAPAPRTRQIILWSGITFVTLDLCCLPITYFYALKFDTGLSLQTSMCSVP